MEEAAPEKEITSDNPLSAWLIVLAASIVVLIIGSLYFLFLDKGGNNLFNLDNNARAINTLK